MHFKELEKLYPLIYFERNMCDFIQMLIEDMDIPALDKVIIFAQFECATSCELIVLYFVVRRTRYRKPY